MNHPRPALALLQPGEPFPPLSQAWPEGSPAPDVTPEQAAPAGGDASAAPAATEAAPAPAQA